MSKYKLSPWHDGSVKPVHVGAYHTGPDRRGNYTWQYWNGEFWGLCTGTRKAAVMEKDKRSRWQNEQWRGILK